MKADTLATLLSARAERRAMVRLRWLAEERESLLAVDEPQNVGLASELKEAISQASQSDRATLVETSDGMVFVHPFNPSLRLAIVGAVHIAQRLSQFAQDLGYEVTVIDPRRGFLTKDRFPRAILDHAWPDAALERFAPDARSAVVTLSHDPKIDEPALSVALRSESFYVGALGSRRTQERRKERLRETGLQQAELDRIHGPVGLDLGAKSPAEIALSIAAELTTALRSKT